MIRKIFLFVLMSGFAFAFEAAAQESGSVWEGTASMSRYGEFPATGYYGASNSFPRNTIIEVENVENGKTTSVIVADRLENPGLFLLLSKEAAAELKITQDETVPVRVSLERQRDEMAESISSERPYTADPDINPSAAVERTAEAEEQEEVPEEEPEEVAVADEQEEEPEVEPEVDSEEPVEAVEETPRLADVDRSPEEGKIGDLSLAEPEQPSAREPEKREPEETEPAEPETKEKAPRLSGVAESPGPSELGEVPMAEPPGPPAPEAGAAEPAPEPPRLSGAVESPQPAELGEVALAEPGEPEEPEEEEPSGPEAAEEEPAPEPPRLSGAVESPEVGPLGEVALAEPEAKEPGAEPEGVAEEEDEAVEGPPRLADVTGSPAVDELRLAEVDEPEAREPEKPGVPEEETPELAEVEESPGGPPEVALGDLDEPAVREKKAEEEAVAEKETEEAEAAEEEPSITEAEEESPDFEIPEDAKIVLEPAEPRPPEDLKPAAVDEMESSPKEKKPDLKELESTPHKPDMPEEEKSAEELRAAEKEEAPEKEKAEQVVKETERKGAGETIDRLESGAYYVQLGVYTEATNARQVADRYATAYPVSVLRESTAAKRMYKVLLGPINRDESGGLLYNFRARGFKDAFIRKGQ